MEVSGPEDKHESAGWHGQLVLAVAAVVGALLLAETDDIRSLIAISIALR